MGSPQSGRPCQVEPDVQPEPNPGVRGGDELVTQDGTSCGTSSADLMVQQEQEPRKRILKISLSLLSSSASCCPGGLGSLCFSTYGNPENTLQNSRMFMLEGAWGNAGPSEGGLMCSVSKSEYLTFNTHTYTPASIIFFCLSF